MQPNPAADTPKSDRVEIYTDGACEPNPGSGGYAAVLKHPKKRAEISGGFRRTTNNRMEILAAIKGLEMLKRPCHVVVLSDSQYVVKAIMEKWAERWQRKGWWRTKDERAANADLWQRLLELCAIHQVEFRWVRGHAGHKENERCDQLSCEARRKPGLPVDDGFESQPVPGPRPRLTQAGQPCGKCSTPVIQQKSSKRHDGYYYDYYLFCPKCKATYEVPEAKRMLEQTRSLL